MSYIPLNNEEITDGAPADAVLFTKVKNNFDNHEIRLLGEEADINVIHAVQIAIDDVPEYFDATNIEDALVELKEDLAAHEVSNNTILTSHGQRLDAVEPRVTTAEADIDGLDTRLSNAEASISGATGLNVRVTSLENSRTSHDTRISNTESSISTLNSTVTTNGNRLTTAESNISTNATNVSNLAGRVTTAESNIVSNTNNITSQGTRLTTAEGNITTLQTNQGTLTTQSNRNTTALAMAYASIDKADFLTRIAINTGTLPVYNSAAANQTGVGVLQSTMASQEITYNTFIPVNIQLGVAQVLTYLAPVGTSMTLGLKCYDNTQTILGNKLIIASQAATGAYQHAQGHAKSSGVGAENLIAGTRFVKPYISWTGNTGTVNIDFFAMYPLLFSQYSLFVD